MQVDPLAGKYPGWSPYNYVLGNPLRYIDPDGRKIIPRTKNQAEKERYNQIKDKINLTPTGRAKWEYLESIPQPVVIQFGKVSGAHGRLTPGETRSVFKVERDSYGDVLNAEFIEATITLDIESEAFDDLRTTGHELQHVEDSAMDPTREVVDRERDVDLPYYQRPSERRAIRIGNQIKKEYEEILRERKQRMEE